MAEEEEENGKLAYHSVIGSERHCVAQKMMIADENVRAVIGKSH